MTLIENILSAQTIFGFLLAVCLWIFTKIFDKVVERAFDKKIISPFVSSIKWRIQAIKTRANPIEADFEISYSPRNGLTRREAKKELEKAFDSVEEQSRERLDVGEVHWNKKSGEVQIEHVDLAKPYNVQIKLPTKASEHRERPDASMSEQYVSKIYFNFGLKFAFKEFRDILDNLDVAVRFLDAALDERVSGEFSTGKFIIYPLSADLTVDDWISDEGFEISILLSDQDDSKTEVELFSNRAEIRPPYKEIDSETARYLHRMILEYYLRGQ